MKYIVSIRVFAFLLILPFFLFLAVPDYDYISRTLAWLVFVVGTFPLSVKLQRRSGYFPFIECIMVMYVLYYSIPVFFQSEQYILYKTLSAPLLPISPTLLLVAVSLLAFWLGFYFLNPYLRQVRVPKVRLNSDVTKLFIFAMSIVIGSISLKYLHFGQAQGILNAALPINFGIAMLSLLYFTRVVRPIHKAMIICAILTACVVGLSSSMTQAVVEPILIFIAAKWIATGKYQVGFIAFLVFLMVLIQPVKLQYRNYVFGQTDLSYFDRLEGIGLIFSNYWINGSKGSGELAVSSFTSRTNLLLQTAHIVDMTPRTVPFSQGSSYTYLLITFVPRILWPDKPSAQDSSNQYAVNYEIATSEGLKRTSYGVGFIGEAYMNFGFIGAPAVFFILGALTCLPFYSLTRLPSRYQNIGKIRIGGIPETALLLTIFLKFLQVGSSVSDVYGGIVQLVIIQYIFLKFFTHKFRDGVLR